jgi:hypothetical protein
MAQEPRASGRQNLPASGAPRNSGGVPPSDLPSPGQDSSPRTNPKSQPFQLPSGSEVAPADGRLSVHTAALADALSTCESALDGLLSKTHEIHEQSWSAVQSLFKDLHLRLAQECEAAIAGFEKEIHERARFETSTLLEIVDVEAKSRLAARVDEALERTREAERRDQQERDEKLEAGRKSLREITDTATQELQRQKTECLESFHLEARTKLDELKQERIDDFEKVSTEKADALSARFAKSTETTLQAFQVQLKQFTDGWTKQIEQRLSTLTESAVARVSNEARTIVTREASDYLIEALRSRLDRVAVALKEVNS